MGLWPFNSSDHLIHGWLHCAALIIGQKKIYEVGGFLAPLIKTPTALPGHLLTSPTHNHRNKL